MNKEKSLLLAFVIALGLLFILCGYSLIQCFVYNSSSDDIGSHVLEIVYLFLHLIMVAIVFYLAFRAFKIKPSVINLMMLDVNGTKMKKPLIISGILAGVFLFVGIYSTLHILGLQTPPLDVFPIGLSHDIMNAGYLFGIIALVFFIYPFVHVNENNK